MSEIWDVKSLKLLNISVGDYIFVRSSGFCIATSSSKWKEQPSLAVWRQWGCWRPLPQGILAWRIFAWDPHPSIAGSRQTTLSCCQLLHSAKLKGLDAASHEAARQRQKQQELEAGEPLPWRVRTAAVPPHSSADHQPMVAQRGHGRARPRGRPVRTKWLVQRGICTTAIYSLSSFVLLFCPLLFLGHLYFLGKRECKLGHKWWFHI